MYSDSSSKWSYSDKESGIMISGSARFQLKNVLINGLEATEPEVLAALDKLRNRKDVKIGRQQWIVVGICLMRLILVYRDLVLYYSTCAESGRSSSDFEWI
jgi:hypothetical protein